MGEKRVIEQVASNEVHNDDWFLKDSPTQDTSKISATNLKAILGSDGIQALSKEDNAIAEDYNSASTYNTGDYAFYGNLLYRCKSDSVTGTWDDSKWEEVNILEYIDYVLENAGKVDDVKVDGTSVVTNKVAEIEIPVKDVEVDGTSVVNASGVAEIILPDVPVQDVQVKTDSTYNSVVDASGNAKIDLSSVTAYGEVPNLPQAIATFNDGADAPMKSLKVAIEPVQEGSGDPSPTNIRPISGCGEVNVTRTGKNLADGEYTANYLGTSGELIESNAYRCTDYVDVTGLTKLKTAISTNYQSMWVWRIASYDANKSFIELSLAETKSEGTFEKEVTLPVNAKYIRACALVQSTDWTIYDKDKMHTYTIDLDGTRYGGELDVVSGDGTDTLGYVDMGTLAWSSTTNNRFVADLNDVISVSGDFIDFMCEMFTPRASIENGSIWINNKKIYVVDTTHSTSSDFTYFVNGKKIVYPLATPLTIQLTPTAVKSLLGQNNIWVDTGDINDCIYRRDMSSTIDDIIARLEALEG